MVLQLADELEDVFEFTVLFTERGSELLHEFAARGIRTQVIEWNEGYRQPLRALQVLNFMRSGDFDIIHQHVTSRALGVILKLTSSKRILHLHGRIVESIGHEVVQRSELDYDVVVCTSQSVAASVKGFRVEIVYHGVAPLRIRSSRKHQQLIIGTAARLVPVKNISLLLRAFALLIPQSPLVRLEIAGDGPELVRLKALATELGIAERVSFLGWQTSITELMARWDVFVLPSYEEGFGIAALDAMSVGIPVIVSNVGGLPEFIEDGVSGKLFPPANPHKLAELLNEFLASEQLRAQYGAAAQARAAEFSTARMARHMQRIYNEICNEL